MSSLHSTDVSQSKTRPRSGVQELRVRKIPAPFRNACQKVVCFYTERNGGAWKWNALRGEVGIVSTLKDRIRSDGLQGTCSTYQENQSLSCAHVFCSWPSSFAHSRQRQSRASRQKVIRAAAALQDAGTDVWPW